MENNTGTYHRMVSYRVNRIASHNIIMLLFSSYFFSSLLFSSPYLPHDQFLPVLKMFPSTLDIPQCNMVDHPAYFLILFQTMHHLLFASTCRDGCVTEGICRGEGWWRDIVCGGAGMRIDTMRKSGRVRKERINVRFHGEKWNGGEK